jgi:hypothetical protein
MIQIPTYEIKIYVGTQPGYEPCSSIISNNIKRGIKTYLQEYANVIGFCTTVTDTEFIYKNGREKGVVIGIINYPRFPSTPEKLLDHAFTIAYNLLIIAKQKRISIVTSDDTYMVHHNE